MISFVRGRTGRPYSIFNVTFILICCCHSDPVEVFQEVCNHLSERVSTLKCDKRKATGVFGKSFSFIHTKRIGGRICTRTILQLLVKWIRLDPLVRWNKTRSIVHSFVIWEIYSEKSYPYSSLDLNSLEMQIVGISWFFIWVDSSKNWSAFSLTTKCMHLSCGNLTDWHACRRALQNNYLFYLVRTNFEAKRTLSADSLHFDFTVHHSFTRPNAKCMPFANFPMHKSFI